jgi:hypothetical protein
MDNNKKNSNGLAIDEYANRMVDLSPILYLVHAEYDDRFEWVATLFDDIIRKIATDELIDDDQNGFNVRQFYIKSLFSLRDAFSEVAATLPVKNKNEIDNSFVEVNLGMRKGKDFVPTPGKTDDCNIQEKLYTLTQKGGIA